MCKKIVFISLIFISFQVQSQIKYNCQYWQCILPGIDSYKIKYVNNTNNIINKASNRLWFDDSLFHFEKVNYIVDTLGLFGKDCNITYGDKKFIFLSSYPSEIRDHESVILLRSIRVYQNMLMIAFNSTKSEWDIYFDFKINAYSPPVLSGIHRNLKEVE